AADAGKVVIDLPMLQLLPGFGLLVTVVECLPPPQKILTEPVKGLPAPERAFLSVHLTRVLSLTATRQHGGTSCIVARRFRHIIGPPGFSCECVAREASRSGVMLLEHAQLGDVELLPGVCRFLRPAQDPGEPGVQDRVPKATLLEPSRLLTVRVERGKQF